MGTLEIRWRRGYFRGRIEMGLLMEFVRIGDRLFYGYMARTAWLIKSGRFNTGR